MQQVRHLNDFIETYYTMNKDIEEHKIIPSESTL